MISYSCFQASLGLTSEDVITRGSSYPQELLVVEAGNRLIELTYNLPKKSRWKCIEEKVGRESGWHLKARSSNTMVYMKGRVLWVEEAASAKALKLVPLSSWSFSRGTRGS